MMSAPAPTLQRIRPRPFNWPLLVFALLFLSLSLVLSVSRSGKLFLGDGFPDLSGWGLVQTALLILASLCMVRALKDAVRGNLEADRRLIEEASIGKGRMSWLIVHVTMASAVILFVASSIILVFASDLYSKLAVEDGLVENTTAGGFLFASVLALRAGLLGFRKHRTGLALLIGIVAVGFFVMGMEEISWFQRIFHYSTPVAFADNRQAEFNLHNLDTDLFELMAYVGSVIFMGWLPLLLRREWIGTMNLEHVRPNVIVSLSACFMAAISYDVWNQPLIQLAFLVQVFICFEIMSSDIGTIWRRASLVFLWLMIAAQATLLVFGNRVQRVWDSTEYRELFIALTCVVYAGQLGSFASNRPKEGKESNVS